MRISPISVRLNPNYSTTNQNGRYVCKPTPCDSVSFSGLSQLPIKKVVIMIGAPNSGKGTFARKIANKYLVPHISTGDILKSEVKNGTELGKKAQGYMNSGSLVPDSLIIDILKSRTAQADCQKGFVLDGFPRTVKQAEELNKMLAAQKNTELKVINLDVEEPLLFARSAARYTCADCSRTYAMPKYDPATAKCECGGKLIKRSDDTPEVLRKRLDGYYAQTVPVLDFYGNKVAKVEVKGQDAPIEETFARIQKKLEN